MISTKQAKKRIKTAKNIAKITKAMELVAASKMKRAQDQAQASRPYAQRLYRETFYLAGKSQSLSHPFFNSRRKPTAKELILLIAPEKGLCGALVSNLYRYLSKDLTADTDKLAFIAVGKKAREIVLKLHCSLLAEFPLGFTQPEIKMVAPITKIINEEFTAGRENKVTAFYAHFVNTMTQQSASKTLLPISFNLLAEPLVSHEEKISPRTAEYLLEPSAEQILEALLPHYLETQIYQLLIEAFASEQSARMVAMKNATDNAREIINELTLKYNKARQAAITGEILDIITASMAISYE